MGCEGDSGSGFAPKTQTKCIHAVRDITAFLGRAPHRASAGDPRRYQLYMRSGGVSTTSMNAAVSALPFFFTVTLGRDDARAGMTSVSNSVWRSAWDRQMERGHSIALRSQ